VGGGAVGLALALTPEGKIGIHHGIKAALDPLGILNPASHPSEPRVT
jgi:hypothetical protein